MGIEFNGDMKLNLNTSQLGFPKNPKVGGTNDSDIGKLLSSFGQKGINLKDDPLGQLVANAADINIEESPKIKAAKSELSGKVSSTGISYADAESKIKEIKDKYNGDEYKTEVPVDTGGLLVHKTMKKFDSSKLPEPDKSAYFEALQSVLEIEDANSALQAQTGLPAAKMPPQNYSNSFAQEELY